MGQKHKRTRTHENNVSRIRTEQAPCVDEPRRGYEKCDGPPDVHHVVTNSVEEVREELVARRGPLQESREGSDVDENQLGFLAEFDTCEVRTAPSKEIVCVMHDEVIRPGGVCTNYKGSGCLKASRVFQTQRQTVRLVSGHFSTQPTIAIRYESIRSYSTERKKCEVR